MVSRWAIALLWLGITTVAIYACGRAWEVYDFRNRVPVPQEMFHGALFTMIFIMGWGYIVLPMMAILLAGFLISRYRFRGQMIGWRRVCLGTLLTLAGPWVIFFATVPLTS